MVLIPGAQGVDLSEESADFFLSEEMKLMPEEIERKFLLKSLPEDLLKMPQALLEQGYLAVDQENGVEVRLRKENQAGKVRYFQTVKQGSGKKRIQPEKEIDAQLFHAFWPVTADRRLTKKRYFLPSGQKHPYELDIYEGKLTGLFTVEIEFDSDQEAAGLICPDWFGEEITDDSRFKNKNLAVRGLPEQMVITDLADRIKMLLAKAGNSP